MQAYRQIQFRCLFHSFNKNMFIHNRNSIVCKSCCACISKFLHIYKLCSLKTLCNSNSLHNMNSRCFTLFLDILKRLFIIYCRFGISHTHNSCKSSSGCCCRTCNNIFFISKSRISEMHMCIDKTRGNNHPICINNLNTIRIIRI